VVRLVAWPAASSCGSLARKRVPDAGITRLFLVTDAPLVKPQVRKHDPDMTQLNTAAVDAILRQAADLVGTDPFSRRLAAVADAWTADKEAAASAADLVETNGAILLAGQLRIREAVEVVHDAAAVDGPSM
jgi:hypothetical protein